MKILLAGASGLIGSAVMSALRARGDTVVALVRRPARGGHEVTWHPERSELDPAALVGVDAVVNLAGENIAARRWTEARRDQLRRSRVTSIRLLVDTISRAPHRPQVLVNASAIGFYGDRGDELLSETASVGRGFLPELCAAWENEADAATMLGVRVVRLRFGLVLAREGGALAKLRPVFRAGLGGPLGDGRAWTSWIALSDVVRLVLSALVDVRYFGAFNAVAPEPVTNREFTRELARAVHRPALFPVPRWALRLAVGAMADEVLLASTRAVPSRLCELGFWAEAETLGATLQRLLCR